MIIYPPYIADTIPAFTTDKVTIPFVLNPAVSIAEIKLFQIVIKDYVSQETIGNIVATTNNLVYDMATKSGTVTFYFSDQKDSGNNLINKASLTGNIVAGQYYKFQLSYSDDVSIVTAHFEAFSTASIGRCIGTLEQAPKIEVRGRQNQVLSTSNLNVGSASFTGIHQSQLLTEPVHSYRFILQNKETGVILQDTDWVINNIDLDTIIEKLEGTTRVKYRNTQHSFVLCQELETWVHYTLTYWTKTINGYENKNIYSIIKQGELPIIFEGSVRAYQNQKARDNGYVQIDITGRPIKGSFELQRTSDNKRWYTLTTFDMTELSDMSIFNWKDWSVEQGVIYTYAIRQHSQGQYSERILSTPIQIEFEHLYLSDGERQLKVAFNAKVSGLKDVLLESKMDTIGSKYPFFFRNETVRYKELPISGLISYLMDDNELFMENSELGLMDIVENVDIDSDERIINPQRPRTTNLVGYNFEAERKFKLSVMDWLNNGKPKLFRSPSEGNYIVRLTNTSLSPNDQLSNMLHSFSSTAYEIMDYNVDNLQKYKMLDLDYITDPDPKAASITLTFDELTYNDETDECELVFVSNNNTKTINIVLLDKQGKEKIVARMIKGTITNIIWQSQAPNNTDYIKLDNELYLNNSTGIFTTPIGLAYTNIVIGRPSEENASSSIAFSYLPDLTIEQGEDEFEYMVATSDDTLFTVPSGQCLRIAIGDKQGTLYSENVDSTHVLCHNIYKTYTLIVRKDESYQGPYTPHNYEDTKVIPGTYDFRFFTKDYYSGEHETITNTIDCSDGQIRYYTGIEQDLFYEKGPGLIVDMYVCVGGMREFNSSILGAFPLSAGRLGG